MTKTQLASGAGITVRALTEIEAGRATPERGTVDRIATALNFPPPFFGGADLEEVSPAGVSFRALKRMTASQRHAAEAAGTLALALSDWIGERFRLPHAAIPKLDASLDAETAAEVVREEWGLGQRPIKSMVHLLEAKGVRVFSLVEESREVDAFSFWRRGTPYVFLNTQKTAEHSRFDAAHELAHLVLHWHHDMPRGRELEKEAQRFASAFLMPRAGVLARAPRFASLNDVQQHKLHWRVSAAAYVYRLNALNLLTEWQYRMLNVELSKRGLRTYERDGLPRETSQLLSKVFAALRDEGITRVALAEALAIHPADLDDLVFGLTMLPVQGSRTSAAPPSRPPLRLVPAG
jgi:Zn-dependent peptidase ImmA (M78 family)/transcriptional regulator with XRE-family HTH domain